MRILREALLVAVAAVVFAVAANQISPRGLKLGRNYFPSGEKPSVAVAPQTEADPVDQRLKEKGLQPIHLSETEKLFHDSRYQNGQIIFVDARDEDHFYAGHIPGAHNLNPYHPEKELGDVLPLCEAADQIVVYCTGGECEDADSDALVLRDAGIPGQKLFVYGGGFDEWTERHLPTAEGQAK